MKLDTSIKIDKTAIIIVSTALAIMLLIASILKITDDYYTTDFDIEYSETI